jgi:N-acetylmuramoyl-L-alanine amidase
MRRAGSHIIVHHTAAEEKDTAQVKRYHVQSLGWRDIGYNYVIERDGRVVTGRSINIAGAHCKDGSMNTKGIGVCMIGNMNNRKPTTAQYSALIDCLATLCKRHSIPTKNILGHKEVPSATACPGKNVNMNQVRSAVTEKLNPSKPAPAPAPSAQLPRVAREIAVRVNGKPVKAKGYLINNTTYLQGLFVAGLFGGSVQGHGDYIDIKVKA